VSAEEDGEGRSGEGIYSTKVPLPVCCSPRFEFLQWNKVKLFFFFCLPFPPLKVNHVWKKLLVVEKMIEFKS